MTQKPKSGLENVPQFLKRPFYTDRIFWIGIAMLGVWIAFFYWLFS